MSKPMKMKSGVALASLFAALLCMPLAHAHAASGKQKKTATTKKQTISSTTSSINMSGVSHIDSGILIASSGTLSSRAMINQSYTLFDTRAIDFKLNSFTVANPVTGYPYAIAAFNRDGMVATGDLQALLTFLKPGAGSALTVNGSVSNTMDMGDSSLTLPLEGVEAKDPILFTTYPPVLTFPSDAVVRVPLDITYDSTPEPTSLVLAACGLAALVWVRRRSS